MATEPSEQEKKWCEEFDRLKQCVPALVEADLRIFFDSTLGALRTYCFEDQERAYRVKVLPGNRIIIKEWYFSENIVYYTLEVSSWTALIRKYRQVQFDIEDRLKKFHEQLKDLADLLRTLES